METLIDEIVVMSEPCEIRLQFIERTVVESVVYVVRFKVGEDEPKETVSHDRELIEFYFTNCKQVML